MRYALLLAVVLAGSSGCDSKAKLSDPAGHPETKSKEYETCGTTAHCDGDLHCFEHVCRRPTRSNVGDYFAAVGAVAHQKGYNDQAIPAYQSALGHYDSEKVPLPPDIDCAYGAALAGDKNNKEHAELAARVLHRCILAVPVGSALRDRALVELSSLADVGLNPLALGGTKLADVYMTGAAAPVPATGPMGVTVTASPPPAGKTFQVVLDKLAEPELKSGLVACAATYLANTKKDTLTAFVGVKSAYVASQYDDEQGYFAISVDPPTALPAGTPEASADTCVHSVVDPAIKAVKGVGDAFATKLTIAVK